MADAKKNTVTVEWTSNCVWKHQPKTKGNTEELSPDHAAAAVHQRLAKISK